MLETDAPPEQRMPDTGDVSGRVNPRTASGQELIGGHAVIEGQPRTFGDLNARNDPHPCYEHIARKCRPTKRTSSTRPAPRNDATPNHSVAFGA